MKFFRRIMRYNVLDCRVVPKKLQQSIITAKRQLRLLQLSPRGSAAILQILRG